MLVAFPVMRGVSLVAGVVPLVLFMSVVDAVAAGTNVARERKEGSYVLRGTADGGYVYNAGTFEARIASNGQVTFKDSHGPLGLTLLGMPLFGSPVSGPERSSLQRTLSDWLRPDPTRPIPFALPEKPELADPNLALPAEMRRPMGPVLVGVTGTFDLTDELMFQTGQGWYRFEKARFLSATFEFRLKMAIAEHRRLLDVAVSELPDRLNEFWADRRYTPREKRRIICFLWAEVNAAEEGGRTVAQIIESWIRSQLTYGSASAYPPGELSECQLAAGVRVFSPYGGTTGQTGRSPHDPRETNTAR